MLRKIQNIARRFYTVTGCASCLREIVKLSIFIFLFIPFLVFGQDAAEIIYNKCSLSTVTIEMDNGGGSGFIVGDGKVITNYHVIKKSCSGYVTICKESREYKITGILAEDKDNDLVLLSVPDLRGKTVEIATREVRIGEQIYVIGSPIGIPCNIDFGIVNGTIGERIRIDANISPGSSGSAVFDKQGKLIGVVRSSIEGDGIQNMNFVIPAKFVSRLINQTPYFRNLPCIPRTPPTTYTPPSTPKTPPYIPPPKPQQPPYTPPKPAQPQKKDYYCYQKNIFGWDNGYWFPFAQFDMGFRYTHNFNPYWGIDFIKISILMPLGGEDIWPWPIMAGIRGNTPIFYRDMCMSITGVARFGYVASSSPLGFCFEAELDLNITHVFYIGFSYAKYLKDNHFGIDNQFGIKIGLNAGDKWGLLGYF